MDKDGKQEFIIRVCCVIAAFVLWVFITSTENPVTAYKIKSIPVQLTNTDVLAHSNLVLVPGQELTIDLNIKGANTNVLLAKKAEDFTVVADLSAYALKRGEQKIPIEIKKSPDNINVVNSDSLFINVNLDELTEAKLPINVNVSGKPKEGFYASDPKLSQDYATVSGGAKSVSIVKKLLIEEGIQGVGSDVIKTFKLKPVDATGEEVKGVTVNPSQIEVEIPVRKAKSVGVTVRTTGNLNPNFTLGSIKILPERLEVTGSVAALKELEKLNMEAIDLSKIDKSTTINVKVLIPNGLSLVSGSAIVKVEINLNKVVKKDVDKEIKKDVDEVVKKNLSQDIKYINLDEKYEVKLAKDKSSLVVSGTQAVINSLDLKKISSTVDLVNLVEGEHNVPVKVTMPKGVNLISGDPDTLLVTITKKKMEVPTSNDNKSE